MAETPTPPASAAFVTPPKGTEYSAEREAARIRWAKRFIARLEGVGQALGYAIFHGGSLVRDIDVVAVPWTAPTADKGPEDFVMDLNMTMRLRSIDGAVAGSPTVYGHYAIRLWEPDHPDHPIDLKVMRPAQPKET